VLSGAVSGRQAWTKAEDATLQEVYATCGVRAARAALPHRSDAALLRRAQKLRLVRRKAWSTRDDAKLRTLWDGCSTIDEIAAALGRRKRGVYHHAQQLGLTRSLPTGWEYLTAAAKRTGFGVDQLRQMLVRAGVEVRPTIARPGSAHARARERSAQHMVWPADVDVAVGERVGFEALATAARRASLSSHALRARLLAVGVAKPRRNKRHWLVSDEQVQRALAPGLLPAVLSGGGGALRSSGGL